MALLLRECASSSVDIVRREAYVDLESHSANQIRTLRAAQNPVNVVRRSFPDNLLSKDVEVRYLDGK